MFYQYYRDSILRFQFYLMPLIYHKTEAIIIQEITKLQLIQNLHYKQQKHMISFLKFLKLLVQYLFIIYRDLHIQDRYLRLYLELNLLFIKRFMYLKNIFYHLRREVMPQISLPIIFNLLYIQVLVIFLNYLNNQ